MGQGDKEIGLSELWRDDGCGVQIEFADVDRWAVFGSGLGFEGHYFGGERCGEETGLA